MSIFSVSSRYWMNKFDINLVVKLRMYSEAGINVFLRKLKTVKWNLPVKLSYAHVFTKNHASNKSNLNMSVRPKYEIWKNGI